MPEPGRPHPLRTVVHDDRTAAVRRYGRRTTGAHPGPRPEVTHTRAALPAELTRPFSPRIDRTGRDARLCVPSESHSGPGVRMVGSEPHYYVSKTIRSCILSGRFPNCLVATHSHLYAERPERNEASLGPGEIVVHASPHGRRPSRRRLRGACLVFRGATAESPSRHAPRHRVPRPSRSSLAPTARRCSTPATTRRRRSRERSSGRRESRSPERNGGVHVRQSERRLVPLRTVHWREDRRESFETLGALFAVREGSLPSDPTYSPRSVSQTTSTPMASDSSSTSK